jgi:hypothetical protein
MEDETPEIYQGNFKYIFVPCDTTNAISEREAPKAGGLEKDALRYLAETQFVGSGSIPNISSSVEIVTLLLPHPDYNFVGVSMYCDQMGKSKNLPVNSRASSIASLCKHSEPVHGDVFFGKFHDDESKPWVRLDFSLKDMSSDAEWIKVAQSKNREGAKSASTSSVLQQMMKQQQGNNNNTQVITSDSSEGKTDVSFAERSENNALKWSQTEDEIEMKVAIPGTFKSSDFNIIIRPTKLQILLKSGAAIPFSQEGNVGRIFSSGGAELSKRIDADSSAWQLEKSKDNKETTIVLTLAKDSKANWTQLLA